MDQLSKSIRDVLKSRPLATRAEWDARPAAVLLPMFRDDSDWQLVYTRRTDHVEAHRGQVSFPGGAIEANDGSARETALREAQEEIGLASEDVDILGRLDTLLTVTQFQITPFIGLIPWPYTFQPNPDEVANIFSVPLSWLMDADNLETQSRQPIPNGPTFPVYYFKPYKGEVIWGATARITLNFLAVIEPLLNR